MADVMEARPNGLVTSPVLTLEVAGGELRSLGISTGEGRAIGHTSCCLIHQRSEYIRFQYRICKAIDPIFGR
jgi:hypothetical protein